VTSALAERLGWALHQAEHQIQIVVPRHDTTILVIDDNEGLAELLARFLSGYQCRVVTASSGREGLRLAEQLRPDAIVLDVMMPEMDGWEVLQSLRTRAESAHIPVIVCSVFNDPGLAHSLDVALFLAKPISREQVLAALRQTRAISAV
jgi:CheY-like chemotaxis protein